MKLRILYHGNCFDGVSSAAVFSKFYTATVHADADIYYTPTMHRAGNAFDREQFDGDENAIVDFKYCPDERLTWWFDHHQSAFLSKDDEQHFLADTSGKKLLDTTSKSCAEFIARIAKDQFGFDDFLEQIGQIKKMGNMKDLMGMIPGVGKALKNIDIPDDAFKGIEAIIKSMTPEERKNPSVINGPRRARLAKGSGRGIEEVNKLMKQFEETRKMMKMMGDKTKMKAMMQQMQQMQQMQGGRR